VLECSGITRRLRDNFSGLFWAWGAQLHVASQANGAAERVVGRGRVE